MSVDPPAAPGTTSVMVRVGQWGSACAATAESASAQAASSAPRRRDDVNDRDDDGVAVRVLMPVCLQCL
ncbi:hypothetical protein [Diaphorobacter aerolatus]|uniref:hypothetical protein n=1 Tax=Diaphorobacter aerolatus TaxID=1288495 RepID=UPI001D02BEE2|nr:hypothetical protein [Diaphorobacter aerolatus]